MERPSEKAIRLSQRRSGSKPTCILGRPRRVVRVCSLTQYVRPLEHNPAQEVLRLGRAVTRFSIGFGTVMSISFLGVIVWFCLGRGSTVLIFVVSVGVVVAVPCAWRARRVCLELDPNGAVISNQFSTHHIAWDDVTHVEQRSCWRPLWQGHDLGSYAVTFRLKSGKRVQAEASLNVNLVLFDETLMTVREFWMRAVRQ